MPQRRIGSRRENNSGRGGGGSGSMRDSGRGRGGGGRGRDDGVRSGRVEKRYDDRGRRGGGGGGGSGGGNNNDFAGKFINYISTGCRGSNTVNTIASDQNNVI